MKFETIILKDHDGTKECNYNEVEDEQCEMCLDTIIRDYYVQKSFKRYIPTYRVICMDCVNGLRNS